MVRIHRDAEPYVMNGDIPEPLGVKALDVIFMAMSGYQEIEALPVRGFVGREQIFLDVSYRLLEQLSSALFPQSMRI